ncbi:MAG: insulinase family protein [Proteobacteria bacterium]|nr:insulinase family protein [Pseudomonadota bacterium]
MAVNIELTQEQKKWLKIALLVFAAIAIILILMARTHHVSEQEGEFDKMLGIKGNAVEDLKDYKTVNGVINIQSWVTDKGARVYFTQVKTLPMVDIEVLFDAGAARNQGKGGVAYLTNTLLAEGTEKISADQVAENFDKVGAQFNAESQRDMALVHLRSLSAAEQLVPAVKNLEAILTAPEFPEDGFKREQQNTLTALKQQAQKPQQVASRAFFELLYPKQAYANWVLGDETAIKALTREDIKGFYEKYYTAKNAVVAIVGDLSTQEADAIAQTLTNELPAGDRAPNIEPVSDLKAKELKKVDFPSSQTTILMGQPGIKRDDPDYYALMVGNHILGGNGSVTRIFDIIRNQHGLAYSAYSYFLPMRERGPFVLGCQTRNEQAKKAQDLMEGLLKEFVEKGPTYKELEQAKQNLIGGYALQFDSNASICHEIAALGFYDLPLDYFNQFKDKVSKLTSEEIKEAFQKRITPEKIVIISVGGVPDPSKVNETLQKDLPKPHPVDIQAPGGAQG